MAKMTNAQITALEAVGFNRWTKGNMDRLYFNGYRAVKVFVNVKNGELNVSDNDEAKREAVEAIVRQALEGVVEPETKNVEYDEDRDTYKVGKTYIFYYGGGHFRGKVVRRTKKTITVEFCTKGTCWLFGLFYEEEAKDMPNTTLRLIDEYGNTEYAVTHKAGKNRAGTVKGFANNLAMKQM